MRVSTTQKRQGTISAKVSPMRSRSSYVHKDQSLRGAEPALQKVLLASCPAVPKWVPRLEVQDGDGEARGRFHVNCGNWTLLTSRPEPQANLVIPWCDFAHQKRIPSTWALNSEGLSLEWMGGLGSKWKQVSNKQARVPPSLDVGPRTHLHFRKSSSCGVGASRLASSVLT
jgi:protein phosphatase 1 regulatory subunit 26